MQKIKIATTVDNAGFGWILETIGIATLLLNKKKKATIEIYLLDGAPVFLRNKILGALRKTYVKIPLIYEAIFFFLNFFIRNKKKLNLIYENYKEDSIENNILINKRVNLNIEKNIIEIKKFELNTSFADFIKALFKTLLIWLTIILSKDAYIKFLNYKDNNISIGDLAGSAFLKIYPQYGGNLKINFKLFRIFLKCMYLNQISKNIQKKQIKSFFFTNPEPTYVETFWKRKFLHLNSKIIETNSYDGKLKIVDKKNKYFNPWILPKPIHKMSPKIKRTIDNYFKKRFYHPHKVLEYLRKNGTNNNKKKILKNIKKKNINILKNKSYAVIYLHAFEDAQYCFGINGFKDMYEWTYFTIEKCLESQNFQKILIKPHPTINHDYKADKIAFEKLLKIYSNSKNVEFLEPKTSIFSLTKHNEFFHFVHHGSVAIELAYLNERIIGSIGGPWSNNYKFIKTWHSKSSYSKLIKDCNKGDELNKYLKSKEHLYSYVLKAHINSLSIKKRSIRHIIMNKYPQFKHEITGSKKFGLELKRMTYDSKLLKEILNLIFAKYNQNNKIYKN